VAERIEKAEKPAKLRDPEPDIAPPAVEAEAPHASPSRHHARAEAKSKAVAKRAARHASASPKHAAAHRRTVARASAAEASGTSTAPTDDSDKMARARDAYREGNERLFHGDAAGAITSYEEMMRLNPKDPGGYRGMGLASAQLGKRTEAVRYLRAYLKHAPNADDRGIIIGRISLLQTLPQ
jgi:Flp pilus assembly protein TadD